MPISGLSLIFGSIIFLTNHGLRILHVTTSAIFKWSLATVLVDPLCTMLYILFLMVLPTFYII